MAPVEDKTSRLAAAQEIQAMRMGLYEVNMQRTLAIILMFASSLVFGTQASAPTVVFENRASAPNYSHSPRFSDSGDGVQFSPDLGAGEFRIPSFVETLPEVNRFLEELNTSIQTGDVKSTFDLVARCKQFYTAERMAQIEALIPGWGHMTSFTDGKTLWHVNLAMVALLGLEEYQSMTPGQQAVLQWIVFLHDVAKEPGGGRDHRHAFRSAALAGRIMPKLGFPVTAAHQLDFPDWFELTDNATRFDEGLRFAIVDNTKLPEIDAGAKRIFAEPTRTAVMAIALHQSITSLAAWPVKAPLTDEEIMTYVDKGVYQVLLTLMLADSGGWNLFDPEKLNAMYEETRAAFRNLPRAPSVVGSHSPGEYQ